MTEIWSGIWQGRYSTEWTGYIGELRKLIPTFTISDFHIGKGVNKYLNLIAVSNLLVRHSHENLPLETKTEICYDLISERNFLSYFLA